MLDCSTSGMSWVSSRPKNVEGVFRRNQYVFLEGARLYLHTRKNLQSLYISLLFSITCSLINVSSQRIVRAKITWLHIFTWQRDVRTFNKRFSNTGSLTDSSFTVKHSACISPHCVQRGIPVSSSIKSLHGVGQSNTCRTYIEMALNV